MDELRSRPREGRAEGQVGAHSVDRPRAPGGEPAEMLSGRPGSRGGMASAVGQTHVPLPWACTTTSGARAPDGKTLLVPGSESPKLEAGQVG